MRLKRDFFQRPVLAVAHDLLGKKLIRIAGMERIGGMIIETEAYDGENDLACHAHVGKTERNKVMYDQGGLAYVYFSYGIHWMLNCVAGPTGYPAAVLIRAIIPTEGLDFIKSNRPNVLEKQWCNGPAKVTRALAISGEFNGCDLCDFNGNLFIEDGDIISEEYITKTPRIGIQSTPEPWLSKPWRFVALLDRKKSLLERI